MEFISPNQYAENIKNKNIEELEQSKSELLQDINRLERLSRHPEDSIWENWQIESELRMNKRYLEKLEEIIKSKGY